MNADQAAHFSSRLGRDMWPPATYTMKEWSYAGIRLVSSTYVACLADSVLPLDWQMRFAERFKVDRMVRIDAGHQVMITRPHAFAEVLLQEAASSEGW